MNVTHGTKMANYSSFLVRAVLYFILFNQMYTGNPFQLVPVPVASDGQCILSLFIFCYIRPYSNVN